MSDGVPCMLMRGGTSKGLYFLASDLPTLPAERDELLLRLMGTPDPRQIDGLGGATSLTSKVAVVGASAEPDADVDYLFLQVGVGEATVSDRQVCGNLLAGVAPFAIERGLVTPTDGESTVRVRTLNDGSRAAATVSTPAGRVDYEGTTAIAGVPGTAAPVRLRLTGLVGGATGALLPTGRVRDTVVGVEVTCVEAGMPVVLAEAASFGITGHETHAALAVDAALLARVDEVRRAAAALMGLGDVSAAPVPKTMLVAPAAGPGDRIAVRAFIPVRPHAAVGVLAAVSAVTGLMLTGGVGHELTRGWTPGGPVDVEHPSGELRLELDLEPAADDRPPTLRGAAVVRTARKLFDGLAYPREHR